MTCERADNKCERCGVRLKTPRLLDFTDEFLCPDCKHFHVSHIVEEYIIEEEVDEGM